jgi:hypothetical protein
MPDPAITNPAEPQSSTNGGTHQVDAALAPSVLGDPEAINVAPASGPADHSDATLAAHPPDASAEGPGEDERAKPKSAGAEEQPHAPEHRPPPAGFRVHDLRIGRPDGRGRNVDDIFFGRSGYVIYMSGGRIMIHYSDDESEATKQIAAVAELIPLRDRLQYMIDDKRSLSDRYYPQIAEAFRLGLENKSDAAKQSLTNAIQDMQELRRREGRMVYLTSASRQAMVTAVVLLVIGLIALAVLKNGTLAVDTASAFTSLWQLTIATASGSIGALLSISIALRSRTVATDGEAAQNRLDARIRLLIGIISAGVLYMLLASGLLKSVSIAGSPLSGDAITWTMAIVIGVAAGFLERLVPDLLEKSGSGAAASDPASAQPPAGGG